MINYYYFFQGPEMAFASMQNTKMTCVFSLDHSFQSELEHVDFDASTVRSNMPLGKNLYNLLGRKNIILIIILH